MPRLSCPKIPKEILCILGIVFLGLALILIGLLMKSDLTDKIQKKNIYAHLESFR